MVPVERSSFGKIASKCNLPTDLPQTPGPANYTTSNPDTYKLKAPVYSMIARNVMPGDGCLKPGPGAHSPERVSEE